MGKQRTDAKQISQLMDEALPLDQLQSLQSDHSLLDAGKREQLAEAFAQELERQELTLYNDTEKEAFKQHLRANILNPFAQSEDVVDTIITATRQEIDRADLPPVEERSGPGMGTKVVTSVTARVVGSALGSSGSIATEVSANPAASFAPIPVPGADSVSAVASAAADPVTLSAAAQDIAQNAVFASAVKAGGGHVFGRGEYFYQGEGNLTLGDVSYHLTGNVALPLEASNGKISVFQENNPFDPRELNTFTPRNSEDSLFSSKREGLVYQGEPVHINEHDYNRMVNELGTVLDTKLKYASNIERSMANGIILEMFQDSKVGPEKTWNNVVNAVQGNAFWQEVAARQEAVSQNIRAMYEFADTVHSEQYSLTNSAYDRHQQRLEPDREALRKILAERALDFPAHLQTYMQEAFGEQLNKLKDNTPDMTLNQMLTEIRKPAFWDEVAQHAAELKARDMAAQAAAQEEAVRNGMAQQFNERQAEAARAREVAERVRQLDEVYAADDATLDKIAADNKALNKERQNLKDRIAEVGGINNFEPQELLDRSAQLAGIMAAQDAVLEKQREIVDRRVSSVFEKAEVLGIAPAGNLQNIIAEIDRRDPTGVDPTLQKFRLQTETTLGDIRDYQAGLQAQQEDRQMMNEFVQAGRAKGVDVMQHVNNTLQQAAQEQAAQNAQVQGGMAPIAVPGQQENVVGFPPQHGQENLQNRLAQEEAYWVNVADKAMGLKNPDGSPVTDIKQVQDAIKAQKDAGGLSPDNIAKLDQFAQNINTFAEKKAQAAAVQQQANDAANGYPPPVNNPRTPSPRGHSFDNGSLELDDDERRKNRPNPAAETAKDIGLGVAKVAGIGLGGIGLLVMAIAIPFPVGLIAAAAVGGSAFAGYKIYGAIQEKYNEHKQEQKQYDAREAKKDQQVLDNGLRIPGKDQDQKLGNLWDVIDKNFDKLMHKGYGINPRDVGRTPEEMAQYIDKDKLAGMLRANGIPAGGFRNVQGALEVAKEKHDAKAIAANPNIASAAAGLVQSGTNRSATMQEQDRSGTTRGTAKSAAHIAEQHAQNAENKRI